VALCLALHKGPLVFALRTYDLLVLCPIHPLTLARYRAACTPSRAHDDPTDAPLQRDGLLTPRDTLSPLPPHRPPRRALEPLVAHRRRVVGDQGRLTHRLTRTFKHDCPQVLQWLQNKDPPLFCDFWRRWPPLKAAHLARRTPLAICFRAHPVRSADVIAPRLQAIKSAPPLTTAEAIIVPHALVVQALVAQLRVPLQALTDVATAIAPRAQSHPAFPLVHALPGAGPVFAPRLLVAFGEQRER